MNGRLLLIAAVPIALQGSAGAAPMAGRPEPVILSAEVKAEPAELWEVLTTPAGVRSFFAAGAKVEPRIGGAYEMYFLPDNLPGLRGGEGVRILAMEAPHRFLITWNAPPAYGALRAQQTIVEFELLPVRSGGTRITLTHSGWGRTRGWQQVRDYFASAWKTVLGRLQYRFDEGPVDWHAAPDGKAYFRPAPQR
jgi:uncharacterized protein YndB with AHSA1/START domain